VFEATDGDDWILSKAEMLGVCCWFGAVVVGVGVVNGDLRLKVGIDLSMPRLLSWLADGAD
jgi:hypothetical protein